MLMTPLDEVTVGSALKQVLGVCLAEYPRRLKQLDRTTSKIMPLQLQIGKQRHHGYTPKKAT